MDTLGVYSLSLILPGGKYIHLMNAFWTIPFTNLLFKKIQESRRDNLLQYKHGYRVGDNWDAVSNIQYKINTDTVMYSYKTGREGTLAAYYTSSSTQCFLIRWLNNFWDFCWILISWFIKLSVLTFQPLIVFQIMEICVSSLGTSISRPLSYPFRSLQSCTNLK